MFVDAFRNNPFCACSPAELDHFCKAQSNALMPMHGQFLNLGSDVIAGTCVNFSGQ